MGRLLLLPLALALLIFSQIALAGGNEDKVVVNSYVSIDVEGIITALRGNTESTRNALESTRDTLNSGIGGLSSAVLGAFSAYAQDAVRSFSHPLTGLTVFLISHNPDVGGMKASWSAVVSVISALYVLMFIVAGLLLLVNSASALERENAKGWAANAIAAIIAVNVSFALYSLLLEIFSAITAGIVAKAGTEIFDSALPGAQIGLLAAYALSLFVLAITLFARQLFLLAGAAILPLAIFLYFVPPLRGWGMMLFNLVGAALVMQLLDALMLSAAIPLALQAPAGLGAFIAPPLFITMALANCAITAFALFRAAFTSAIPQKAQVIISHALPAPPAPQTVNVPGIDSLNSQISSLIDALRPLRR